MPAPVRNQRATRALLLGLLFALSITVQAASRPSPNPPGKTRTYYIAAEDILWDFAPSGRDLMFNRPIPAPYSNTKFRKTHYVEYTDATFKVRKPQPEWMGILGPVIRAEVGDTVVVHFVNHSTRPLSMHPHGLRYTKDNEGAPYIGPDGRSIPPVLPGDEFTYTWFADESSGPGPGQPSSILWPYHSHVNEPVEVNEGLIGPIIVTARGKARPDGSPRDVDDEFIVLFMVFDHQQGKEAGMMHSINGYIFGNLPDLSMDAGKHVRWHVFAMGNERDVHTAHWHGKTVYTPQKRMDVVEVAPAMSTTVDMQADNPGNWMLQCHVADHMEGGMMAFFSIVPPHGACPVAFSDGDFWKDPLKVRFSAKNQAGKTIRNITYTANAFIKPQYLISTYALWRSEKKLPAGGVNAYEFSRELPASPETMGWVVYPIGIEYEDGTRWTPQINSECFHVFWRDGNAAQPKVLPPIQTTGIKEKEKD